MNCVDIPISEEYQNIESINVSSCVVAQEYNIDYSLALILIN